MQSTANYLRFVVLIVFLVISTGVQRLRKIPVSFGIKPKTLSTTGLNSTKYSPVTGDLLSKGHNKGQDGLAEQSFLENQHKKHLELIHVPKTGGSTMEALKVMKDKIIIPYSLLTFVVVDEFI